ncbi:MAG: hypothetical protein JNJ54_06225 [Myxococcaceae bacterium]|nr:hypothetical protein [Myxococcaceae bacterium]
MALPALALDVAAPNTLCCSMCGKDSEHVRYLMAGAAGGHLCDACTVAAMKIVLGQRVKDLLGPTVTASR